MPPSAVEPAGVYQRWSESEGSGLDDPEIELVYGLFTDRVQGPPGGPLTFERYALLAYVRVAADRTGQPVDAICQRLATNHGIELSAHT